jgi:hypothetical protein
MGETSWKKSPPDPLQELLKIIYDVREMETGTSVGENILTASDRNTGIWTG